ncbi:MAG: hypothetical protein JRI70_11070 [Deltaproteobacteria bacterium]|nr:hypothetical protein [Deltaproteobacteria bacterium]
MKGEEVLIYGAGHGGQVLLKEILDNKRFAVKPVGFIDDDITKVGKRLAGYPVMGQGTNLETILEKEPVKGLIISCRDMTEENQERIIALCRSRGLFLKRFIVNLEDIDLEQDLP